MHKIIDFHSHLGDIFAYQRNVIYKQHASLPEGKYNPFEAFSKKGFQGPLIDASNPKEIQNIIDMTAEVSWVNTLEHYSARLDRDKVDHVCMYPVLPHIGFEDYLAASKLEPRIIPFTSIDQTLGGKEAGKKVLKDVKNGARGLKIHPILQPLNLNDPILDDVFAAWEETELPVTSHCGVNSYYPDDMAHYQNPENGNLEDFINMVKRFPKINFVSAHCGGLTGGEMDILAEEMAGTPNMWVDTTFRNVEDMRKIVKLFGEDKVLFGVDVPFASTRESINVAFEAFGKYTPLSEKIMYSNAAKLLKLQ